MTHGLPRTVGHCPGGRTAKDPRGRGRHDYSSGGCVTCDVGRFYWRRSSAVDVPRRAVRAVKHPVPAGTVLTRWGSTGWPQCGQRELERTASTVRAIASGDSAALSEGSASGCEDEHGRRFRPSTRPRRRAGKLRRRFWPTAGCRAVRSGGPGEGRAGMAVGVPEPESEERSGRWPSLTRYSR